MPSNLLEILFYFLLPLNFANVRRIYAKEPKVYKISDETTVDEDELEPLTKMDFC